MESSMKFFFKRGIKGHGHCLSTVFPLQIFTSIVDTCNRVLE